MTGLRVSYLGDRAHHERFARVLATAGSSFRWAGSDAGADIVLTDAGSTVVSGVFLVCCPSDRPLKALPAGIRGVLNCTAPDPAELLGLVTKISGPRLTTLEIEVLSCAAAGMTLEATAQRLAVTPGAGRSLMDSASRKLGARTRANAVALAFRHGLVR
ncbi:helix-turn-helix transcriptional regulator [Amycolatopsis pithecellobii]|uniref:HTH luxR-type domain-containing protein n=1 Tax=Amycolatopsis pithecellobii TaxID=664692 RepID=A0A6N7Z4F4_9PSEU|nr:helix-turn-helix transcriptional regulator [Amycolatopsis pithecellobii]MTD56993.1 hypothetical protein [Amycolatopsis pithecellobii]